MKFQFSVAPDFSDFEYTTPDEGLDSTQSRQGATPQLEKEKPTSLHYKFSKFLNSLNTSLKTVSSECYPSMDSNYGSSSEMQIN